MAQWPPLNTPLIAAPKFGLNIGTLFLRPSPSVDFNRDTQFLKILDLAFKAYSVNFHYCP